MPFYLCSCYLQLVPELRSCFLVAVHNHVCATMFLQARARKVEAETKLAGLQQDIGQLSSLTEDQVGGEEAEVTRLQQVRVTLSANPVTPRNSQMSSVCTLSCTSDTVWCQSHTF